MSWTKREIVTESFSIIGFADYSYDLSPEQLQKALRSLDLMIANWGTNSNINIGYPLPSTPSGSSLEDDSNVPDSTIEAITYNLAIRLCPAFGKIVTPEIKQIANTSYKNILKYFTFTPERQITGLPRGAGAKAHNGTRSAFLDDADTNPLGISEGGYLDFKE